MDAIKQLTAEITARALVKAFPENTGSLPSSAEIKVNYPDEQYGHYAVSAPLELARMLRKNPLTIAAETAEAIRADAVYGEIFESAEAVKPGYINFRVSGKYFQSVLREIQARTFFTHIPEENADQKILLEFVSANPTGPLHIGHGRWAVIGSVLAHVLRRRGFNTECEFYVNDAGNQIEKLIESVNAIRKELPVPEDGYHGNYLHALKNTDDEPVDYFLKDHKETLLHMQTGFDRFFRESALHSSGAVKKMLGILINSGAAYTKDGAVWLNSTKYGDDKDRVLVKSDGSYTYFAVDIAYHHDKISRGYNLLVNVFGADHHGYVHRLNAAVALLSQGRTRLKLIIGQLVSLFRNGEPVKMSKRTGEMITLKEVTDEIGSDALRYFLAARSANSPLDFDLELAKKQSMDNPVYYIQYAYARICSVRNKASELFPSKAAENFPLDENEFLYETIRSPSADSLCAKMLRYPEELDDICRTMEIHHLPAFLYIFAGVFHKMYNETKFVHEQSYTITVHYLMFLDCVQHILSDGLALLGIHAPEKM